MKSSLDAPTNVPSESRVCATSMKGSEASAAHQSTVRVLRHAAAGGHSTTIGPGASLCLRESLKPRGCG